MIPLEHIVLLAVITFFNTKLNRLASFVLTLFAFTFLVIYISTNAVTLNTVQMLIYLMFIVVNIVIVLSRR